ncbi:MAG: type II toxin-antitoxin system RelE/ParE family toxin [Betaproteobacteria bacterium]|nr:type II toxin-antitoxin system RelE/ParE family toxin [Betaproteobacteria bacterium]
MDNSLLFSRDDRQLPGQTNTDFCRREIVVKAHSPVFQASGNEARPAFDAAVSLKDPAVRAGNRFEALKGDRKAQYSIRINDQWRNASRGLTAHPVRSMSRSWDYH